MQRSEDFKGTKDPIDVKEGVGPSQLEPELGKMCLNSQALTCKWGAERFEHGIGQPLLGNLSRNRTKSGKMSAG